MKILGVHPVDAFQQCFLVEVAFEQPIHEYKWAAVHQEIKGRPRSNRQVPWDERPLDADGIRWAFFFHHLDIAKKLMIPGGAIAIPTGTPMPEHLHSIEYQAP